MSAIRRVGGNWLSLMVSDVATRASTFAVYVLVGRKLGAFAFGQMSLALTFFYLFQVVAAGGLKALVTREVSRDPSALGACLGNGAVVVAGFSALAVALVLALVRVLGYSASTSGVVLLTAVGLLPASFAALFEGVLQGRERMVVIACANVPVAVARVLVAFLLLLTGHGVFPVVLTLFAGYAAIALAEGWYVGRRVVPRGMRWSASPEGVRALAGASVPFLGVDALVAVTSSATTLLLSRFGTERDVGLYAAASQLTIPFTLVFRSIVLSVYPLMCRGFATARAGLEPIANALMLLLMTVSIPAAVAVFVLAEPILELIYGGRGFQHGAVVLEILAVQLVIATATSVLGQVLFATLRERVNLRSVAVDAAVMAVLAPVLISQYKTTGAAVTTVIVAFVDFLQHYVPVNRMLAGFSLPRMVWPGALCGVVVGVGLAVAGDAQAAFRIAVGVALYAAAIGTAALWRGGEIGSVKRRYAGLRDPG